MADFNKPATTDTYANVLAYINAKFSDLALALDPATSTPTNLPTNAVRWNSANNRFEKYNGTAWAALSSTFAFNDVSTSTLTASSTVTLSGGTANGVPYLNASKQLVSGSALTFDGSTQLTLNGTTTSSAFSVKSTVSETSLQNVSNDGYLNMTGTGGFIFRLGSGYTEVGRFTSAGLAIGTSSLATNARLHVYATGDYTDEAAPFTLGSSAVGSMRLYAGVNNTNNYVYLGSVKSGTRYADMVLQPNGGNLGLGVTPSAWGGTFKALQVGTASLYRNAGTDTFVGANFYFDGSSNKYISSAPAAAYGQVSGAHQFFTAPPGTAGNAISFTQAMTLDASGRLIVGGTSASAQFHVRNANGNAGLGSDNNGMALVESTYGSTGGNSNASYIAKNFYGYSQFMQWENFGLRIGSRGTANGGAGDVIFTYGGDAEGMRLAGGYLGIGNTIPGTINSNNGSGTLVVGSGSGSQGMTIYSGSSSGNEARLTFANASSGSGAYAAQITYKSGDAAILFYNGNAERMRIASDGVVTGAAGNLMSIQASSVATTSGTTADFTGIPSWVKKIKLIINEVKVSGTGNILVQIGNASLGIQTSGYTSQYNAFNNSPGGVAVTNGVQITGNSASTYSWNGIVEIINVSGNSWVVNGTAMTTIAAVTTLFSGSRTMTAVLDRVRVTVTSGGFTAGSVNIIYE